MGNLIPFSPSPPGQSLTSQRDSALGHTCFLGSRAGEKGWWAELVVRAPAPRPRPLSRPLAVWESPCPPADPPVRTWPWGKFSCALSVRTPPPERTKSETTLFGKVIPEHFPHGAGRSSRREVPCARPAGSALLAL